MRNHTAQKRFIRFVAGIVVFCTCFLCLPVYAQETVDQPVAESNPDLTAAVLHTHDAFCRDSQGTVICPLQELEEHTHEDACYEVQGAQHAHVHVDTCYTLVRCNLTCTEQEVTGHTHSDDCYEIIPPAETEPHEHTGECYTMQRGELTCVVAEFAGHAHGDGCYIPSDELLCTTQEDEAHTHTGDCYGTTLICETPEADGHSHGGDCYAQVEVLDCAAEKAAQANRVLTCTQAELPSHTHADTCYAWDKAITCGMEETPSEGTAPLEPEKVLICDKPELTNHTHEEACYETDAEGNVMLVCTLQQLDAHQHTADCLTFADADIICGKEAGAEHTHTYTCCSSWQFLCQEEEKPENTPVETPEQVPVEPPVDVPVEQPVDVPAEPPAEEPEEKTEPDPYVDDETRKQWEKTFAHVKLTGAWSHDLLNIAESQLGYEESDRNFIVAENGDQKGYTRYGDWYGFKYGDWCAMFVSFCLDYAGVKDFPLHCNCNRWIEELKEAELYITSDAYMPKPGDIVFLDYGRSMMDDAKDQTLPDDADHVAIVAQIIPETEDDPAKMITIEGNHGNCVCYETRDLDDTKIIGYGMLPDGPAAVYSCGLRNHIHDAACFEEENLNCRLREHTHDEICRSRKLHYSDESISVDITLSNAVYVPVDVQLKAKLVSQSEEADCGTLFEAVDKAMAERAGALADARFCRLELLSDGESFQPPVGVQADVTVCFAQPVSAADAEEQYTFMLVEEGSERTAGKPKKKKSKKTEAFEAVELTTDNYGNTDEGVTGMHFAANQICTFAVAFAADAQTNGS